VQVKFAEKDQVTKYKPEEQVARVKAARRQLETALETKKSALKIDSRERPVTAFSQPDEGEEVRPRPRQRPGKKQRAAYQKRMAQSGGSAIPPAEPRVRLLPAQSKAAPKPAVSPPPAPWDNPKGKSKGKKKKGKGKSGGGPRQARTGKGQPHPRPPRAQSAL